MRLELDGVLWMIAGLLDLRLCRGCVQDERRTERGSRTKCLDDVGRFAHWVLGRQVTAGARPGAETASILPAPTRVGAAPRSPCTSRDCDESSRCSPPCTDSAWRR